MSFEWFESYPPGVVHEINPDQYESLVAFCSECFVKYADLPCYDNMGKTLSYAEIDTYSDHFAAYLQSIGLVKGDRIAIQMPNLLQYPVVMFGALKAGLIVVNTNPLYTPDEMRHQFKDAGIKAIVILANFAYNLEKIKSQIPVEHIIITEIGDMLGGLKGMITNLVVKYIKKMIPAYQIPNHVDFKTAMRVGKNLKLVKPVIKGDDIAFLQYTGGTTGLSKGAMLSNRNVLANMIQIAEWKKPLLKEREEIIITALPLYHVFALTVNCLSMLKIGARNILITNPRDMKSFISDMKKYPYTIITGVNTLFNGLLHQEEFRQMDFSKLKVTVGGGMAVQAAVAEEWQKVTGVALLEGYGLTESSPVLSCNPVVGQNRLGTIGVPLPSTELTIRNDDGMEVAKGEPGEVWARGPQVMVGYWNQPAETQKTMSGDWLKTGDIGKQLDDGFYKIVDRKKEMILVSGFNVYPNEVEDALVHHPKIKEVGVIAVADPDSGEVPKAFIVKADPSLTEEEVRAFAKEKLTGYKRPKYYEFRDDLPKSNVGKIMRRLLKESDQKK